MDDIYINGAWRSLRKMIAKQSGRRIMAIAYVTSETIPLRRGDQLVCDASRRAITSGNTSAKVLDTLQRRGVEIYGLKNLHAKIAVCGQLAIIGSANYSESSESILHEAVLATENGHLLRLTLGAIGDLRSDATRITQSTITRLLQLPVERKIFLGWKNMKSRELRTRKVNINAWVQHFRYVDEDDQSKHVRESISKGREKWRLSFRKPKGNPIWFSLSSTSRLGRLAKMGTVILSIGFSGKRRTCDGFYTVFDNTKSKGVSVLTCQETNNDLSLPWGSFLKWAHSHHVDLPKRHSRALTTHEYQILCAHPKISSRSAE